MGNNNRYKLLGGPYRPPRIKRDGELLCERRGYVLCKKWSDGPISWPCTARGSGNGSYILCGDLVKAVRRESSLAIQHWWGVSVATVLRWRTALGVEQFNEGTRQLCRENAPFVFTPRVTARGQKLAATPKVRAKAVATWRRRGIANQTRWTTEQRALLGTMSDTDLAEQLGRSVDIVKRWRCRFNIPTFKKRADSESRRRRQIDPKKLWARRMARGLLQKEIARRANIAPHTYCILENGFRRSASEPTLRGLARALGCEVKAILAQRKRCNNKSA